MRPVRRAYARMLLRAHLVQADLRRRADRGDVPGWVLVAVMTAGLVTGLWLVADDQLKAILQRALSSVSAP